MFGSALHVRKFDEHWPLLKSPLNFAIEEIGRELDFFYKGSNS